VTGKEFLDKHGERIARLIEARITAVKDYRLTAQSNFWHSIERSCTEEITELETVLSEREGLGNNNI